jgi:hypothetical protein
MSAMIRGLFPKDLRPGVKKWFGMELADYSPLYSRIFQVLSDDRAFVENALLSGLGTLQVMDENSSVRYDSGKQGYTPRYDHIKLGLGFQVSQELMDDGIGLSYAERYSKALKRSSIESDEIIAHQILNRAFNSSFVMTNGDGVALCDASHPIRGGSVFSNKPAVAADLSEAALEQAVIDISAFTDDRGIKKNVRAKKLIIHTTNQFEAHRILKSQLRVDTANNDINALKDMGVISDIIVTPYLTDTDSWFLVTDAPDGLKFYNRKAATIDSDSDFDTNSGKFKVVRRLSVGWDDPRGVYGSAGA